MSVGRYVRGLNSYDLLGNIIPGTIGVIVILGFLSSPPIPDDIGEYGLFIIAAFIIGSVSQVHASKAVGSRESFDRTMDSTEVLSTLQYKEDNSGDTNGGDNGENDPRLDKDESRFWNLHPLIGPLCGWWRPKRGEKMDDVILANRIWEHLIDTYEIPFETESYSVLYHVMSSRIDNIQSPSRAIRIQAIRNFYRGMWVTSWYSLVLIGVAIGADIAFNIGDDVLFTGVEYTRPIYFDYWDPVWHLAIVAFIGIIVFWVLFESTEEDYLEYLFADYAVAIGSEGTNILFDDKSSLVVSGDIHAQIESDTFTSERNDETIEENES